MKYDTDKEVKEDLKIGHLAKVVITTNIKLFHEF